MNANTSTQYRLVVDTDTYAGSFERPMIAYATGQVGECGVGQDKAELAIEELPPAIISFWEENAVHEADDHGCHRPASIYPTVGFFNHGLGEEFPATEEGRKEGLARYKIAVRKWVDKDLADLARVVVGQNGWTQEHIDQRLQVLTLRLEESEALTQVREYPSYQSVSILCREKPSEEILASFIQRVQQYVAAHYYNDVLSKKTPLNILSVAIQEETTEVKVDRRPVFKPR